MYVIPLSYIFLPVPDDGFTNKPKNVACFGQYKIFSGNAFVFDRPFVNSSTLLNTTILSPLVINVATS